MKKIAGLENNIDDKNMIARRIGLWSFAFFAIKGVFWLMFTAAAAWYGMN